MALEDVMLSEVSQLPKKKYDSTYMRSLAVMKFTVTERVNVGG